MFTGIVEEMGRIISVEKINGNVHLNVTCNFTNELKIDQSVAHNGVCLTITEIHETHYSVVAVKETLAKSNLGALKENDSVNLERCMKMNARLDGHIVQGHVDTTAEVVAVKDNKGSKNFTFKLEKEESLIVEKGSITINGVSLTTFNVKDREFSVTIIPYTLEHTTFKFLKSGDKVNLEYDIIGKYVQRLYLKNFGSN